MWWFLCSWAIGLGALAVTTFLFRKPPRGTTLPADDSLLKRGASAKKLQDFLQSQGGAVDYIVVGSGLGGLATAAFLSKRHTVLVLEQHDIAGGSTHTFEEGGFEWDVGLHYVGGRLLERWSILGRLFDVASGGMLEWSRCDKIFDHAIDLGTGTTIDFVGDRDSDLEGIAQKFGLRESLGAYSRALDLARLCAVGIFALKIFPKWLARLLATALAPAHRWAWARSAKEVMRRCGLSDEAIGALTYLYGDYGVPPGSAPFALHALVATHYEGGAFYPKRGSRCIAKAILARSDVACFVRAPVTAITPQGVVCKGVELPARLGVVSNAGSVTTRRLAGLPPPQFRSPSVALVYLFVGLDGSSRELGLDAANSWLHQSWRHDDLWAEFREIDDVPPVCFLSCGSAKDDLDAPATLQLLVPVKYEWFAQWEDTRLEHRGSEYVEAKRRLEKRLLETFLYVKYPSTRGRVVRCVVASPLTTNHYLNATAGATYGLDHSIPRFRAALQLGELHTQIAPRLYLVGQDHVSVGIGAALFSALITTAYLDKTAAGLVLLDALRYALHFDSRCSRM